jgi:DNA-binding IclR family transcriptional regulator
MPRSPNYTVPALEKGLDVLEILAAAAVPQSLAELGVALNRSSSELFRMLNCLEQRGYVRREQLSGKFRLTLKLYSLAHAHSVIEKLLQAAQLPMRELTEKFRESCHLSVLERGTLLVVAQQESPERVRLSIEVGAIFDAVATASGRLLLAQLNGADLAVALGESEAGRKLTGRPRETFGEKLVELRKRGISTAESETIEGVRDVAVLVGNPALGITAVLAVTRLLRRGQRGNETSLIEGMSATAAEITKSIGLAVAA